MEATICSNCSKEIPYSVRRRPNNNAFCDKYCCAEFKASVRIARRDARRKALPEQFCLRCNQKLDVGGMGRKFCSLKCRQAHTAETYRPINFLQARCTADKGAMCELLAGAHLMRNGYQVFRSLSPSAECDLIAIRDNSLLRVEVKSGSFSFAGTLSYPTPKDGSKYDVLLVVDAVSGDVYSLPGMDGFKAIPTQRTTN